MNWLHSLDQILFEIGARCHHKAEFYRVMTELLDDRYFAVISALSENQRSESKNTLAKDILKDQHENRANKLRSAATLLESASRTVIAQPALDAALTEIACLENILKRNTYTLDQMYFIQHAENGISTLYDAFLELTGMGMISLETHTAIINRGLEFDMAVFEGVTTRQGFYQAVVTANNLYQAHLTDFVTPNFLKQEHVQVIEHLRKTNLLPKTGASGGLSRILSENGYEKAGISLLAGYSDVREIR